MRALFAAVITIYTAAVALDHGCETSLYLNIVGLGGPPGTGIRRGSIVLNVRSRQIQMLRINEFEPIYVDITGAYQSTSYVSPSSVENTEITTFVGSATRWCGQSRYIRTYHPWRNISSAKCVPYALFSSVDMLVWNVDSTHPRKLFGCIGCGYDGGRIISFDVLDGSLNSYAIRVQTGRTPMMIILSGNMFILGGDGQITRRCPTNIGYICPLTKIVENAHDACSYLPTPVPVGNAAIIAHEYYIHIIGGNVSCNAESSAEIMSYNSRANRWEHIIPPMPQGRIFHTAGIADQILYIVGGCTMYAERVGGCTKPACEIIAYDFTRRAWFDVLCRGYNVSLIAAAPYCWNRAPE